MSMSIKLEGLQELQQALVNATKELQDKVELIVEATASDIHRTTVRRIQRGPATGHIYRSSVANKEHQASAPGEAPMSDSGRLAGSYSVVDGDNRFTKFVSSNVWDDEDDYAYMLEFGTTKIKPRPHLLPSVEEARPTFERRLKGVLQ
jgi:hypothetical protein